MSKITVTQEGTSRVTIEHEGAVVLDYSISNVNLTIDQEGLLVFFKALRSALHSKIDALETKAMGDTPKA